jgi:hypothetical protein
MWRGLGQYVCTGETTGSIALNISTPWSNRQRGEVEKFAFRLGSGLRLSSGRRRTGPSTAGPGTRSSARRRRCRWRPAGRRSAKKSSPSTVAASATDPRVTANARSGRSSRVRDRIAAIEPPTKQASAKIGCQVATSPGNTAMPIRPRRRRRGRSPAAAARGAGAGRSQPVRGRRPPPS